MISFSSPLIGYVTMVRTEVAAAVSDNRCDKPYGSICKSFAFVADICSSNGRGLRFFLTCLVHKYA
eukprot:CAMPEP_0202726658 /NCGR_PEP_ID=MMETSP1385-20130828/184725_1 /ASSEMBLY_ACC=CAM_ASM_000861 /TAXON_ID=933848 /ORGANISM="Elphidium margaritaceum" /LENGTH=65 /DNA_ID=CAMNT_0049392883 /DNA_START=1351 /DNA_END=1544 /DNA_ORIENTATION=-